MTADTNPTATPSALDSTASTTAPDIPPPFEASLQKMVGVLEEKENPSLSAIVGALVLRLGSMEKSLASIADIAKQQTGGDGTEKPEYSTGWPVNAPPSPPAGGETYSPPAKPASSSGGPAYAPLSPPTCGETYSPTAKPGSSSGGPAYAPPSPPTGGETYSSAAKPASSTGGPTDTPPSPPPGEETYLPPEGEGLARFDKHVGDLIEKHVGEHLARFEKKVGDLIEKHVGEWRTEQKDFERRWKDLSEKVDEHDKRIGHPETGKKK